MGRPLSVQELLLAKRKTNDIRLLNEKPSGGLKQSAELDILTENNQNKVDQQPDYDIESLIDAPKTKKKVDKLIKLPARRTDNNKNSASLSFSQTLLNKKLAEMTTADWKIYAKLNRIDINSLSFDKSFFPVRDLQEIGLHTSQPVKLDSLAQYSINYMIYLNKNATKMKPFLGIDNATTKTYSILCYVVPILYALKNDTGITKTNNSAKPAPIAIILAPEDKVDEIKNQILEQEKITHVSLSENLLITTFRDLSSKIDKNQINYHLNLRFLIVDFLNLQDLKKVDELVGKLKVKISVKAFFIRKQTNLSGTEKEDYLDKLDNLIESAAENGYENKDNNQPTTFSNMNIVKLR